MRQSRKLEIINAYDSTKNNAENIESSNMCGCYNCLKIFEVNKVKKYVDNTAVCPYCAEQSLIPDNVGIKLDDEFLKIVHKYWT